MDTDGEMALETDVGDKRSEGRRVTMDDGLGRNGEEQSAAGEHGHWRRGNLPSRGTKPASTLPGILRSRRQAQLVPLAHAPPLAAAATAVSALTCRCLGGPGCHVGCSFLLLEPPSEAQPRFNLVLLQSRRLMVDWGASRFRSQLSSMSRRHGKREEGRGEPSVEPEPACLHGHLTLRISVVRDAVFVSLVVGTRHSSHTKCTGADAITRCSANT